MNVELSRSQMTFAPCIIYFSKTWLPQIVAKVENVFPSWVLKFLSSKSWLIIHWIRGFSWLLKSNLWSSGRAVLYRMHHRKSVTSIAYWPRSVIEISVVSYSYTKKINIKASSNKIVEIPVKSFLMQWITGCSNF